MKLKTKILDKRLGTEFKMPYMATKGSAGMDLIACIESPLKLSFGQRHLVPTGMAIHIDDPHYAAFIFPRSGLGHKQGLILGNSTGLIDSDYQGELFVSLWSTKHEELIINPGEKIAQLVVMPVVQFELEIVDSFEASERGSGGFGSTGV